MIIPFHDIFTIRWSRLTLNGVGASKRMCVPRGREASKR